MKISYWISLAGLLGILSSCAVEKLVYVSDRCASPQINPLGGIFYEQQLIELTCSTAGATIIYTTDGTTPSRDHGFRYAGRFNVSLFSVVKAFAYAPNLNDSQIVRSAYSFQVSKPLFYQQGNLLSSAPVFSRDVSIEVSNTTPQSTIFFSVDGTSPSSSSAPYTGPLTVSQALTLKAVAYRFGWAYSDTQSIPLAFKLDPPGLFPSTGIFQGPLTVTLTPGVNGSEIRYTLDGSTPTAASPLYTAALTLQDSQADSSGKILLKAIAIKPGLENSEPVQGIYIFAPKEVDITPHGGRFLSSPTVTLTSTPGSTIYYTLDNTDPDPLGVATGTFTYVGPLNPTHGQTIKALAVKASWAPSAVSAGTFLIDPTLGGTLAPVTSDTPGQSFTVPLTVNLSSPPLTQIYYTTDGSTPSLNHGHQYENPLQIQETTVIKALAVDLAAAPDVPKQDSPVSSWTFTQTGSVEPPQVTSPSSSNETVTSSAVLEATCATTGAEIRFTLDGSDPLPSSNLLTGPFSLASGTQTLTVKLKAFKTGLTPSGVVTATVNFKLPPPGMNPGPGTYAKRAYIALSQGVLGAETRYTIDGSDPSPSNGAVYNLGQIITLTNSATLKVQSFKSGWAASEITTGTYTVNP